MGRCMGKIELDFRWKKKPVNRGSISIDCSIIDLSVKLVGIAVQKSGSAGPTR